MTTPHGIQYAGDRLVPVIRVFPEALFWDGSGPNILVNMDMMIFDSSVPAKRLCQRYDGNRGVATSRVSSKIAQKGCMWAIFV